MSDQDQNGSQNNSNGGASAVPRRRGWLGYIISGVVGAVIGVAGVGLGVKHFAHGAWQDEARFERMVDRGVDRFLDRLDATDDQRVEVKRILVDASGDVRSMALEMRGARREFVAALTDQDIDRERIETLRAARIAALDEGSQRTMKALADAAEKLTPAQRAKLAKRFERRHQ